MTDLATRIVDGLVRTGPDFLKWIIGRAVRGDTPEDMQELFRRMRLKVDSNRAEVDDLLDEKHGGEE